MIIGIGNDICDIRRIEKVYEKYGARFLNRIFTAGEQKKALQRSTAAPTLAKRFAAKEACAKALGTGMSVGVFWKDMGVVNLLSGQPTLALTGGALLRLEALTPKGMSARIHLTLTDEYPHAQAHVIIEAIIEAI
ncbi:MAG: holo-ACP synthase [Alphaproteobacteria bacterium]|nr:holo-ACP synthase [Alphaproteobacteria bacterium]